MVSLRFFSSVLLMVSADPVRVAAVAAGVRDVILILHLQRRGDQLLLVPEDE